MIGEFLKNYGELISITLIPFIIWILGAYFQDRKSKKDAKMSLFLKLMATRKANPISKEWVDSLNQIDVVFQDSPKVRLAWRQFFDALHPRSAHFDSQNSFHLDLLSEMANNLGYKDLKQTEIDRYYNPQLFGNLQKSQDLIARETLRVLSNSKAYGVAFSPEEFDAHTQQLYSSND
ncbi:hypothetical protein K6T82_07075 [Flavobacterium sp. 17A]|uniref:DUF6680 domain-containing protein n=1 Tax=Flavobacterium potami TaxID=2872310 RepID=A0A9X1KQ03_9FLAO|nr:DUF6680 family protein [Flavobacterium potami]MBZ4034522.1 hypothetical protein [Flavobacterium potami]